MFCRDYFATMHRDAAEACAERSAGFPNVVEVTALRAQLERMELENAELLAELTAVSGLAQIDIDGGSKGEPATSPAPDSDQEQLQRVPYGTSFTGLLDKNDKAQLVLDLRRAGGAEVPAADAITSTQLQADPADKSTWSKSALEKLSMAELANLRVQGLEENQVFHSTIKFVLGVQCLGPVTPNLRWDLGVNNAREAEQGEQGETEEMYLFPMDKFELTHSGHANVQLCLDSKAFTSGTDNTSAHNMRIARRVILSHLGFGPDENPKFIAIAASPLHSVTLPDAVRDFAHIPRTALFFNFAHAVLPLEALLKGLAESRQALDEHDRADENWDPLHDPFFLWLTRGAYVYYDYKYVQLPEYIIRQCGIQRAATACTR